MGSSEAAPQFLASYLPFLLVRADTLVSRELMADLDRRNRSVGEWRILATLHETGELTIAELTELVLFSQPSVSRLVAALDRAGLVSRSGSTSDRRQTVVRITPSGSVVATELEQLAHSHLAAALGDFDPAELATVQRILGKLIEHLGSTPR